VCGTSESWRLRRKVGCSTHIREPAEALCHSSASRRLEKGRTLRAESERLTRGPSSPQFTDHYKCL
jgi:hypothetical protein